MEAKKNKLPSALAIGFIGDQDVRILDIAGDEVAFESCNIISGRDKLTIALFDVIQYDYVEFIFEEYDIQEYRSGEFSHTYRIKILIDGNNHFTDLVDQIKEVVQCISANGSDFSGVDCLKKRYEIYPQTHNIYDSYKEQIKAWYSFQNINESCKAFQENVENVEMALNINNYNLYSSVLRSGFTEFSKKALEELGLANHGMFYKGFQRVYIGNEFCKNLFPETDLLIELLNKAHIEGYEMTICLPFTREQELTPRIQMFDVINNWCRDNQKTIELVINDLGYVDILADKFSSITPVLGRLLNKRKKDSRFNWKWGSERFKYTREENYLNNDRFIEFLNNCGIQRFEFEMHKDINRVTGSKHSLHFPFYQTNTSENCILYADCFYLNRLKQVPVDRCPHYCEEFVYLYPESHNLIGKGNSIFGFSKEIFQDPAIICDYTQNGIDRLVFSLW